MQRKTKESEYQFSTISQQEPNLIQRFTTLFNSDEKLRLACQLSCIDHIERNTVNRIFDDFPSLLSNEQLHFFSKEIRHLIISMQIVTLNQDEYTMIDNDKSYLTRIEKKLILLGCRELFAANGKINNKLINLLNLESFSSQIDARDIICAYVGATNLTIFNNMLENIHKNIPNYTCVCHFINKNYRKWAGEILNLLGINYKLDHQDKNYLLPKKESDLLLFNNDQQMKRGNTNQVIIAEPSKNYCSI